jgi:hypothetical protein
LIRQNSGIVNEKMLDDKSNHEKDWYIIYKLKFDIFKNISINNLN